MSRLLFTTLALSCFMLGIWLGTPFSNDYSTLLYLCFTSWVTCVLSGLWRHPTGTLCIGFLSILIGILHVSTFRSRITRLPESLEVETLCRIDRPPEHSSDRQKLFVNCQLEKKRVVFLAHAPPYPQYSYGQTVTIIGKAKQVSTFEGFDYPLFLERQGATHSIQNAQVALQSEAPLDLKKFLFSLRSYLERKIETHLPEPESSLLNGILLGSNQNLSEELTQTLRNTGTSHIVAISGANVTIVVGLLVLLLPLYTLKSQRNATIVISLLLITMTGASASVVRGGVVASLGSCVKAAGRRKNLCGIILLPACCMLMWNPLYLKADPSFQLSLAAYSGILLLSPSLEVLLGKIVSTLPSAVSSAFKETAAATLGTLPVSFLVFGSVSWLGLLVNPAVLWLLPVITILGGIFLIIPISLVGNLLWLALHVFLEIILTFSHVFS